VRLARGGKEAGDALIVGASMVLRCCKAET
jgi:hypothetical protein